MRIALAGLGGAARRGHIPALRHLAARGLIELTGICDPNPTPRREAGSLLTDVPAFDDTATMLDHASPDLVVIATDPAAHMPLITLALGHGCHVVCEKPVFVTEPDLAVLRRLRDQPRQPFLAVVHQYRHSPGWRHLMTWSRSFAREQFNLVARVERPGTDPHASSSWRTGPDADGAFGDHAVHFLALARDLDPMMAVASAERTYDPRGNERVHGQVVLGNGFLEVEVDYGARTRGTTVTIEFDGRWMTWSDNELRWSNGDTIVHRRTVPALSKRTHVDALYLDFYHRLLASHATPAWRSECWQEVLDIGRILVDLNRSAATDQQAAAGVVVRP